MTDIFVKGENVGIDTHREDKDRGDGFTGQGRPKTVNKGPVAGGAARSRLSLTALRRNPPCCPLDFGLLTPRIVKQLVSVF